VRGAVNFSGQGVEDLRGRYGYSLCATRASNNGQTSYRRVRKPFWGPVCVCVRLDPKQELGGQMVVGTKSR
jgi:hypothetical protein